MKPTWKYVAVYLVIGWFLGAASVLVWNRCQPPRLPPPPERMASHLTRKLNLSPEQEQRLKVILTDRREKMNQLKQATKADIRVLLTPDQQVAFDRMNAERERRMKKRGEKRD